MKLFVWDFHGVLEKGNDDAITEVTNLALEQHGFKRRMTAQEAEHLAGSRWYEYFSYLLPDQTSARHKELQLVCQAIVEHQPEIITRHIQLNDHVHYVLDALQQGHVQQILISNTPPQILDFFVKLVGIEAYFPPTHRFGIDNHSQQNYTKRDCLTDYLKNNPQHAGLVSIGDSPHDVALSQLHPNGVGYLYTHPNRTHREADCHHRIHDLRCVLQELM